jgi:arginyl-tRNA synthetase
MAPPDARSARTLRESARMAVREALARATEAGRLPASAESHDVAVEVSRPANPDHGDLASNVALRLARPLRMAPTAIAAALATELSSAAESGSGGAIASAEAAGPGFVNLRFADAALEAMVDRAREDPAAWGRAAPAAGGRAGRHVNVEFVSATREGRSSATCSPACSRRGASASPASTTSTIRARR